MFAMMMGVVLLEITAAEQTSTITGNATCIMAIGGIFQYIITVIRMMLNWELPIAQLLHLGGPLFLLVQDVVQLPLLQLNQLQQVDIITSMLKPMIPFGMMVQITGSTFITIPHTEIKIKMAMMIHKMIALQHMGLQTEETTQGALILMEMVMQIQMMISQMTLMSGEILIMTDMVTIRMTVTIPMALQI